MTTPLSKQSHILMSTHLLGTSHISANLGKRNINKAYIWVYTSFYLDLPLIFFKGRKQSVILNVYSPSVGPLPRLQSVFDELVPYHSVPWIEKRNKQTVSSNQSLWKVSSNFKPVKKSDVNVRLPACPFWTDSGGGGGESQGNPMAGGECHLFWVGNCAVLLGSRHFSWWEITWQLSLVKKRFLEGQFRRYDFCLWLSYATFVECTAHVKQRSYTICHSSILIVATTVVGF